MLSPNVNVVSTTGTTEGDTVTLQCEDGLSPALPLVFYCQRPGVWNPDPAELVCISPQGELIQGWLQRLGWSGLGPTTFL